MSLVIRDLSFSYPSRPVFEHFSLTLPQCGAVCLSGPSGCGKTTLLRLLLGLEQPDSGRITGNDPATMAAVFQEDRLLPWLTVRENVELGAASAAAVNEALAAVQLESEAAAFPASLSGGMQRRVAIARALAAEPAILLLDEPFNGLDRTLWEAIALSIRDTFRNRLIVLVSHRPEEADALGAVSFPLPTPPAAEPKKNPT